MNPVCVCERLQVEQVRLVDRFSNKSTSGTLYLTATHLIFVESSSNNSTSAAQEVWVSGSQCFGYAMQPSCHLFVDVQQRHNAWMRLPSQVFVALHSPLQILHHHIASVEKLSLTTSGCPLVIQCRNFRVVHFVVQRERDCHDVYSSLLRLLRPGGFHSVRPIRWPRLLFTVYIDIHSYV